jgi:hypothetical protein
MHNQKLLLAFPERNTTKLKRRFPTGDPVFFLYLGKDIFARRHLDRQLGNRFIPIDITKILDEVANDIRREHIQWIDNLNIKYGKNLNWWFGPIPSRNIYSSNLFQFSCYLELLERLWNSNGPKPSLVFVESIGLLRAIQTWALQKGIAVETVCALTKKYNSLRLLFLSFLRCGYFYCISLLRFISAYRTKHKCGDKSATTQKLAIINTFLLDSSLSDEGFFQDFYFPFLHEYLADNDYQVFVHPVLHGFQFNYFSIYRRMRQSNAHFIIREDFLKLSDYLSVLRYVVDAFRFNISTSQFRGFDLSALLKEEQQRNGADSSSMLACLIHRFWLRLGQQGLKPEIIIDWYENQVIDKALITGARQAFPQAKIIGAQIFLHSLNCLNTMPIQSEVDYQMVPDILLETSEHQCSIARSFTKDIPCHPAASLRYAYIFHETMPPGQTALREPTSTIMVLLPYDMIESMEMLEMVKGGLDRIRRDVRLAIKCHPCYFPQTLKRSFGERDWPDRFEFYQGSIRQALKSAAVVISANSSTMAEAAALGIPVIFLGRKTVLSQNMLVGLTTNLVTECFTEDELVEAINKYLEPTLEEIKRYLHEGEKIRKLLFSPVNEKTMQPFLGKS